MGWKASFRAGRLHFPPSLGGGALPNYSDRKRDRFPPKGSVLEGKWDPENFREIVWLVKDYNLARSMYNSQIHAGLKIGFFLPQILRRGWEHSVFFLLDHFNEFCADDEL